jgi:hypothetical protein
VQRLRDDPVVPQAARLDHEKQVKYQGSATVSQAKAPPSWKQSLAS